VLSQFRILCDYNRFLKKFTNLNRKGVQKYVTSPMKYVLKANLFISCILLGTSIRQSLPHAVLSQFRILPDSNIFLYKFTNVNRKKIFKGVQKYVTSPMKSFRKPNLFINCILIGILIRDFQIKVISVQP